MPVEVKIPGLIVDDLELDALAADVELLNRSPYPDEIEVRQDGNIAVDIAATDGSTITGGSVEIYISTDGAAEVLAYDDGAGGFQAGFAGSESATSNPDASTLRVVIDSTLGPWPSEAVITVRVVASSSAPASINESYEFTIEDVTPPQLLTAVARTQLSVRLTFDEAVKQVDATAADDALNPANYAFDNFTVPSVAVTATSVETVSATEVDVFVDLEWTQGADYRVTITGVEDTEGNEIVAPYNSDDFTGYVCPRPAERDFNLWRMIPRKNRDEDILGELEKFIAILQDVADLELCAIDRWTDILDVDLATEPYLDAMLADVGNPFTSFDLEVEEKRRLLRVLVAIYQQKGTGVGIINVVRFFLDIEVTITEWNAIGWILGEDELGFDVELGPSGSFALYSYAIETLEALTSTQVAQITAIAEYMQPAHTHLVEIVYPGAPATVDHLELGLSELGPEWILH